MLIPQTNEDLITSKKGKGPLSQTLTFFREEMMAYLGPVLLYRAYTARHRVQAHKRSPQINLQGANYRV